MGTYQLRTVTSNLGYHGGCLQTSCNPLTNLIQVTLTGSPPLVVQCPKEGGDVNLATLAGSNYVGILKCPASSKLCTGEPCDIQDCSGHGTCNIADGTCTCQPDFYGSDAYSCNYRTCPTSGNSSTPCSGHGLCNRNTGICEDGNGNQGCYAGWSGSDCARQGCPQKASPFCPNGGTCECSGSGTCTSGACVCNAGYIGNDCSLTDCPGSPYRCFNDGNQLQQGVCDTSTGLCTCADTFDASARPMYFYGADCARNVTGSTRPFTTLNFVGETNSSNANQTYAPVAGRLNPKEYQYFQFEVPTTQYPITLTLYGLTSATMNNPPIMTASYATSGHPTAGQYDFGVTSVMDSGRTVQIQFASASSAGGIAGGGGSGFSKTGTVYVAVVLQNSASVSYLEYSLELRRDGCAVLSCAFGVCSNGRCVCDRRSETSSVYGSTYGWSGTLCDQPDCPGTPDCSGQRGSCIVPAAAYSGPNNTAVRGNYPQCQCYGVFAGQDCSSYNAAADRICGTQMTMTLDGTFNVLTYSTSDAMTREYWLKDDGTGASTFNATYRGSYEVGASSTRALIDTDALAAANWGLASGSNLGLYARLTFSGSPAADGIMLTQVMIPPTLSTYRDFDIAAWRAASTTQEISTVVSTITFLNIFNGYYAKERLQYTLYVEISSGCPPSLRGCSGHGTCALTCACDIGWEGIRCDVPVPLINPTEATPTSELNPGDWQYFVFKPSESPTPTQEVTLQLARTSSSAVSWPLVVSAWDSGRYGTSIGKVTSETVYFDYASVAAQNSTFQSVTVRRTNAASQKWLYIGVRNLPTARASFQGSLLVTESASITMPACVDPSPAVCRETRCTGHGTYTVINSVPSCACDYGWNKDTACASPIFSSFSDILSAAQNVGFLCSVCTERDFYSRDRMSFYKIPQPLQKSTGLSLSVSPVETVQVSGNASSTVITGHPSLLVSASLPRSILDFVYVISGQTSNQSTTITQASSTGSYWAAVYANTPGTFLLKAQRAKLPITAATSPDSAAAILEWLVHSTAGYVVLGVGGFLMAITVMSCLAQCCCGRSVQMGKLREVFDQMEQEHLKQTQQLRRSMERIASMDPEKLAMRPALASALSKRNFSVTQATMAEKAATRVTNAAASVSTSVSAAVGSAAPRFSVGGAIPTLQPLFTKPIVTSQPPQSNIAATSILMQSMSRQDGAAAQALAELQSMSSSPYASSSPSTGAGNPMIANPLLGNNGGNPSGAAGTPNGLQSVGTAADLRAALRASAAGSRAAAVPPAGPRGAAPPAGPRPGSGV